VAAAASLFVAGCGGGQGDGGQVPANGPATPGAFEITGRWEGELRQRGLRPFRVEATIRSTEPSGRRNTVRYSGIDCAGRWSYLGREGATFRFRETIEGGRGRDCKGVGTVSLTPVAGDRLAYEFEGGGVTSRGTLARAGVSPSS
jgi:hypothetical protein